MTQLYCLQFTMFDGRVAAYLVHHLEDTRLDLTHHFKCRWAFLSKIGSVYKFHTVQRFCNYCQQ